MNLVLGTIGEGGRAHRLSPSAKKLDRIANGGWVELGALGCSAYGRVKIAPDHAPLCKTCFHGDTRNAGEWRAANDRAKGKATADALFGVFGMKEAK